MVQNLSQKNSNIINEITEKSLIKVHFGNSKQEKLITVILHSYRTTTTTRLHLSVRDKLFISSGKSSRLNPLSHPKNGYKDELHRKKKKFTTDYLLKVYKSYILQEGGDLCQSQRILSAVFTLGSLCFPL